MVEIIEINPKDKKTFKKFVKFPLELYKGSPYYVPMMFGDEMSLINPKKNVAYDECAFKYFLAYKNGKLAGRIAAIIQHSANAKWGYKNMRFSRFDFINDLEVVKALLGAVEAYAAEEGMTRVHGPFGINDMDREGLLAEGFDKPATLATNYNYDYYAELIRKCGYEDEYIWNEYSLKLPEAIPEKIERVCNIAEKKFGLCLPDEQKLKVVLDKYAEEVFDLYDETYAKLPGTMPLTAKMRKQMLSQFKLAINVNYLPIVLDKDNKVVGFGLAFPDITKFLMARGGRLTPSVIIKIFKQVRRPKGIEFALVGAKPGYEHKGATALIIKQFLKYMARDGIVAAESNPELTTNLKVQSIWSNFEHEKHKLRLTLFKNIGEADTSMEDFLEAAGKLAEAAGEPAV